MVRNASDAVVRTLNIGSQGYADLDRNNDQEMYAV